jgi:hypothetical protein
MKRMVNVGSIKRKPAVVSRSKQMRSQVMGEISLLQAEAKVGGALSSNDLRAVKVEALICILKVFVGDVINCFDQSGIVSQIEN